MSDKNNMEKSLIKYSITLLLVAMICIAIGGISLSKSISSGDGRITKSLSAKNNVQQISNDNLNLKKENETLKKENAELIQKVKDVELEKEKALVAADAYSLYIEYLSIEDKESEEASAITEKLEKMGYKITDFEK